MDRYERVQDAARKSQGRWGPAEPGFQPISDAELVAMEQLVSAIEAVRLAKSLWVEAGRPALNELCS